MIFHSLVAKLMGIKLRLFQARQPLKAGIALLHPEPASQAIISSQNGVTEQPEQGKQYAPIPSRLDVRQKVLGKEGYYIFSGLGYLN